EDSGNLSTREGGSAADERNLRVIQFVLPSQQPGPPLTTDQLAAQLVATNGPRIIRWIIGGKTASDARNAVAAGLMLSVGQGPLISGEGRDASQPPVLEPGTPAYGGA